MEAVGAGPAQRALQEALAESYALERELGRGGMATVDLARELWRGDGRELYYWQGDQLIAARLDAAVASAPPAVRGRAPLFRAPYAQSVSANYDASSDGSRFVIVTGGEHTFRLVLTLNALQTSP